MKLGAKYNRNHIETMYIEVFLGCESVVENHQNDPFSSVGNVSTDVKTHFLIFFLLIDRKICKKKSYVFVKAAKTYTTKRN